MTWLVYPKSIYNNEFNILKSNIEMHIQNGEKDLSDESMIINKKFTGYKKFSAEKIIILHCENNGYLQGIKYDGKISLINDRKKYIMDI